VLSAKLTREKGPQAASNLSLPSHRHVWMTAFEERDAPHMIEVRVKNQQLRDPSHVDTELLKLRKQVRHDIAHATVQHQEPVSSFKEIDS
jgi:hypothetical protein